MVDNGDAKQIALLDDTAIERDPVLDAAIGPALLAAIGRDGGPDRLRLYRPGPTVATAQATAAMLSTNSQPSLMMR